MNITPANYTNYNHYNSYKISNKSNPSFGMITFTDVARFKINEQLKVADFHTRNKFMHSLEQIIKESENTRAILVDAPEYMLSLVAKVGESNPKGKRYGLKTFIQSNVYDTKFLEDALEESKKPIKKI